MTPNGMCLVIYAYGDDGSDEKGERSIAVSIVAGYEHWWQKIEDQWIVRCGGIPFHATDCESNYGDYKNIPHDENKATYRDLTGILATCGVGGIGVAFDLGAQQEVFPHALPLAYVCAFSECLDKVANVAENLNEVCEITYDISKENEYNAGQIYASIRESNERFSRLLHPKISFASWRDSARIQAADLIAFEAWKALDHAVGPTRRTRKSWEVLRATGRFETFGYSKQWFEDLKKHLATGKPQELAGFSESDYSQWLQGRHLKHSVTNLVAFVRTRK